jgi:uncharacterized protein YndB with AHSA1/START domain
MNPNEANSDAKQTIVVEYDFPHPPEKVWRVLTEPDLLAKWLMPNDIQAVVGHAFTFHTQPVPGFDGIAHCQVLVAEPYRRLSYSWRGGSHELHGYGAYIDTVVTWTLTPTSAGGTHLRLEHGGFAPEVSETFDIMDKGWRRLDDSMGRVLATVI